MLIRATGLKAACKLTACRAQDGTSVNSLNMGPAGGILPGLIAKLARP